MKSLSLDDRRVVLGGAGVVALVFVALTWFLFVGPQRTLAAEYDTSRADVEQKNASLEQENAQLDRLSARLPELKAALAAAQRGLPSSTELPELTRQVTADAKAAGVSLDNVAITPPTPVAQPAADPPADSSAGDSPAATGQQAISVSLTSTGSLSEQRAFLDRLQKGPRRMLVGSSQLTAVGDAGQASLTKASSMLTQVTIFTSS